MPDTCKHTREISAYHDGELPLDERARLHAHVGRCPACALELQRLQAISRLLMEGGSTQMPADALSRLHGNLPGTRDRAIIRMARMLTAAAAAVLVVCGAWLWSGAGANGSEEYPSWERAAAIVLGGEAANEPQQIAQWISEDLLLEQDND